MRRKDSIPASISSIANCDTRTGFLIDLDAHEYRTYKVVKFWPVQQIDDYLQKNPQNAIQIESKTVDTGERKTFFGYLARHLITTNRRSPDKDDTGGKETIDGWYIDHELPDNNCAPDYARTDPLYVVGTGLVMLPQVASFHHTGPLPAGLAVKRTLTHKIADGENGRDRIIAITETVEELSDSPLSPSLFELPSGLHENSHLLGGK